MHTFLSLRTIQISVPSPQPTCASSDTPARRPFRAARRRWASPRKPKRTAPVRPDLMRPHASRPHRRGAHSQPQKSWGYNARHRCLSAHRLHRPRGPAAHGRRRLHLQTVRPRRTCRPCRCAASQAHGRGRHISQRAGQRAAGGPRAKEYSPSTAGASTPRAIRSPWMHCRSTSRPSSSN